MEITLQLKNKTAFNYMSHSKIYADPMFSKIRFSEWVALKERVQLLSMCNQLNHFQIKRKFWPWSRYNDTNRVYIFAFKFKYTVYWFFKTQPSLLNQKAGWIKSVIINELLINISCLTWFNRFQLHHRFCGIRKEFTDFNQKSKSQIHQ